MFYSQLLLSKKGALGIVWMAAHCHKRLKKDQVQSTDISSSVDKILDDEVPVVTHRILAFLLLGIVRIYSKKVEYLFHDCHEMLNRLSGVKTGKSTQAGIGVSRTRYHSITLPKRFELDTFDLDLVEDQDVIGRNVRSHQQDTLADGRRRDGSKFGMLYKDFLQHAQGDVPNSEAYSTAHTPPRDVFGPHHMDRDLFVSPSKNMNFSLAGLEFIRGTRFSLEDRLDPMLLDETEEEQMHNKLADEDLRKNSQGPTNMESEFVLGLSNYRDHLLPSLEILHGTEFALEDRLEPMVLDEAEKEQLDDRPSNSNITPNIRGQIQDMEFDFVTRQSPRGSDSLASPVVLHESSFPLEQFSNFMMFNEAGKGQGNDKPSDKGHENEEEHVQHLSAQLNFQQGEHRDFTGSVDKTNPVKAKMKQMEAITPVSIKRQRPEEFRMSVVPPEKLPGVGTPEVVTVQTPGRKEYAKILKKRKTLLDLTTVVPNKVFKNWIEDPADLIRGRREVRHTLLDVWKTRKLAHVPQSFFEPLITGISTDLGYLECKKSSAPAIKSVELSAGQDGVKSPATYGAQEHIPDIRSPVTEKPPGRTPDVSYPVTEKSPGRTPDVSSPVTEKSPDQTPIAPGTPVAHLNPLRSHEAGAVADSDREPATSFESIEKWPSFSEPLELDNLFQEETSSVGGDSSEKDTHSARTRMTGSYLSRKFMDKKLRKEEEVLNLSDLLAGKTKKESARLFYEILVLKTRDCILVQQENAYDDILLRETPRLRQVSEN